MSCACARLDTNGAPPGTEPTTMYSEVLLLMSVEKMACTVIDWVTMRRKGRKCILKSHSMLFRYLF